MSGGWVASESAAKEVLIHYQKPERESVESIQHRQHQRFVCQQPSLSEYANTLPTQPADVSVVQPSDDRFRFFAKGRDFQPHWKQHKYTPDELHILQTYEGSSRLPSNSLIYREWSSHHNYSSLESIGWGIITLVSVIIGLLTFAIKELCERFQIFYNPLIKDYIERGEPYKLFLYHAGMSCSFVALSAAICVYICPYAAGSGIPEIICILNGTVVRNVLSFRTFVCKIASVSFAVLSGLPLGFEGPLIHIGGMVGALVSRPASPKCDCQKKTFSGKQVSSSTAAEDEDEELRFDAHPCCRYRDCEERHSLICLGAACGIASAFSAPISAILFVIEEISTHWSALLTWKAFVGCILARSVTEVVRTLTVTLESYRVFNFLELSEAAVFYEKDVLSLNLLMVIPSVIIGVIGGLLGVTFILLNLKMAKCRRRILGKIKSKQVLRAVKVMEPVCLALLSTFVIMGTLPYFTCKALEYEAKKYNRNEDKFLIFRGFQCDTPLVRQDLRSKVIQTGEYHEAATLLFGSWEQMIRNLLSRKTPAVFSAPILAVVLVFFFFVSSWVSLTSIASGFLICQLAIGALYGRLLGVLTYKFVLEYIEESNIESMGVTWNWIDPGAFAMLGAAAFLAGTARLPITSVVLMVEITNDINLCLLIMIVVMIAKAIGDSFTHPLYHSIIEFKCIPFLELELDIRCHKKKLNLDLFDISAVMASPVQCIQSRESVQVLANFLLNTNHGGFPVVRADLPGFSKTFLGMITRMELTVLLTKTASFKAVELERECRERIRITYPDYSAARIKDTMTANMILSSYATNPRYRNILVNLVPYVNTSAHSVRTDMSIQRAYNMFRSLGLRHLVITDHHSQVVGIITRKDLMGYIVVSKLKQILRSRSASDVGSNEQIVQADPTS